jgi:hypothetical protein
MTPLALKTARTSCAERRAKAVRDNGGRTEKTAAPGAAARTNASAPPAQPTMTRWPDASSDETTPETSGRNTGERRRPPENPTAAGAAGGKGEGEKGRDCMAKPAKAGRPPGEPPANRPAGRAPPAAAPAGQPQRTPPTRGQAGREGTAQATTGAPTPQSTAGRPEAQQERGKPATAPNHKPGQTGQQRRKKRKRPWRTP